MSKFFAAMFFVLAFTACASGTDGRNITSQNSFPEPSLEKIAESVWIHKSYALIEPWGVILSQGLVISTDAGLILVDTTWDNNSTELLLELIAREAGALPTSAIVTHAHQDKMGGMDALHKADIQTFAHKYTNEDAPKRGLTPAKRIILENSMQSIDADGLTLFHPGPGHTRDNIVAYYAPAKILFGGCLIRPGDANSLGNTADADISNWADAVRNVAAKFPDAKIIIPSHGAMGGRALLDHTIALAEAATSN
jgi:metallo-beta-lactamase class B